MNALHIVVAMKPVDCSNADNAIERGVCGLNIDGARIGTEGGTCRDGKADKPNDAGWENMRGHGVAELNAGRWPANIAHDGSLTVVKQFPETGPSKPNMRGDLHGKIYGGGNGPSGDNSLRGLTDEGGSTARFFKECKT